MTKIVKVPNPHSRNDVRVRQLNERSELRRRQALERLGQK
jgi:hypothetical protein